MRTCDVSGPGCEYSCSTECFACGMPACKTCTVIADHYWRWKKKRICVNCLPQHAEAWGLDMEQMEWVLHESSEHPAKNPLLELALIGTPRLPAAIPGMPKARPSLAEHRAEAERQHVESRRTAIGREPEPVARVVIVCRDGIPEGVLSDNPRISFAFWNADEQDGTGWETATLDAKFVARLARQTG